MPAKRLIRHNRRQDNPRPLKQKLRMNILGSPTDQEILAIEPMLSCFYARSLEKETRSQTSPRMILTLNNLKCNPEALKIADMWIAKALPDDPKQPSTQKSRCNVRSHGRVFLEYMWLVSQERRGDAAEYLNQQWRRRLKSFAPHIIRPNSSRNPRRSSRLPATVAHSNVKRAVSSGPNARLKAEKRKRIFGKHTPMPRNPNFNLRQLKFKKFPKAETQAGPENPIPVSNSFNNSTQNQAQSSSANDNFPSLPSAPQVPRQTPTVKSPPKESLGAENSNNSENRLDSRLEENDSPPHSDRYLGKRKNYNSTEIDSDRPVGDQHSVKNNQIRRYPPRERPLLPKRPRTMLEDSFGSSNVIGNRRPVDSGRGISGTHANLPQERERAPSCNPNWPISEARDCTANEGYQFLETNAIRIGAVVDTIRTENRPVHKDQSFERSPKVIDVDKSVLDTGVDAQTGDCIPNGFRHLLAKPDQKVQIDSSIADKLLLYSHPNLPPGPNYAAPAYPIFNHFPFQPEQRAEIAELGSLVNVPSNVTVGELQSSVEYPWTPLTPVPFSHLTGPAVPGAKNLECNIFSQDVMSTSDEKSQDGPDKSPGIYVPRLTNQIARSKARTSHSSLARQIQVDQPFKNPLPRLPPIWAQSRQELCESFDWFRSYHGGVYYSGGYVKGYLLSAFSSSRDIFRYDGRLIISHGGGKSESLHVMDGEHVFLEATDQSAQDHSVNALLATYQNCRPIVLLIDDKYALFPYDLAEKDVTYAVLGFYVITHAWAEYQSANDGEGHVIRYKFAFQWCTKQGTPWWLPSGRLGENDSSCVASMPTGRLLAKSSSSPRSIPSKVSELSPTERRPLQPADIYATCCSCGTQSPHVYRQGWVCLKPKCTAFWKTQDGAFLPDQLEYTDNFLTLLSSPAIDDSLPELQPITPDSSSEYETSRFRQYCRGWHCKACGRLSCRYQWECLECSCCRKRYQINPGILDVKVLNRRPKVNFYQHLISPKSGIRFSPVQSYNYGGGFGEFQTYTLPLHRGYIHHIRGKAVANSHANMILQEYQEHAVSDKLLFRRWPLRSHKTRGTLLANYFSQNSGQPYQYVGAAGHTVPLEHTSSAVRNALQLIQNRIRQALHVETDFNEVLTAAYMQQQKMAFHSDDERGLGPMVAGLSLGSPALMHFRLNPKFATKGVDGGIDITFLLCHGDILVMDGAGVQDFYQHTVIPYDFRIAATARRIDP